MLFEFHEVIAEAFDDVGRVDLSFRHRCVPLFEVILDFLRLAQQKWNVLFGRLDEFSERAYPSYAGGTAESRALRDLLRATMEAEGFTVYPAEWWHFDFHEWKQYRIQNQPFEVIGR